MTQLSSATRGFLLLTAVPTVFAVPSYVVLQRTERYRFDTEYLSWVFRRDDLVAAATDAGLTLVREFVMGGNRPIVRDGPEAPETRAYLFAAPPVSPP